jgi:polyhydroxyalkanoate synthesis regulator phasin
MHKRAVAVVAGIALAGGLLTGAILASPPLAGAQESQDTTTTTTVESPEYATLDEVLADLVDEGVINQDQADAVADAIRERGVFRGRHGHFGRGAHLDTVAEALGLDLESLITFLQDGQTIADIADDNGVDLQSVIDALVAEHIERIDEAVADGRLSEEEASEKRDQVVDRVTAMVNGEMPAFEGHHRGHHGFRGSLDDVETDTDAASTSA